MLTLVQRTSALYRPMSAGENNCRPMFASETLSASKTATQRPGWPCARRATSIWARPGRMRLPVPPHPARSTKSFLLVNSGGRKCRKIMRSPPRRAGHIRGQEDPLHAVPDHVVELHLSRLFPVVSQDHRDPYTAGVVAVVRGRKSGRDLPMAVNVYGHGSSFEFGLPVVNGGPRGFEVERPVEKLPALMLVQHQAHPLLAIFGVPCGFFHDRDHDFRPGDHVDRIPERIDFFDLTVG